MYFRNNRGLSLIELSITVLIMGLIATGVTKFVRNTRETSDTLAARVERHQALAQTEVLLSNHDVCTSSLSTVSVGGVVSKIVDENGNAKLEVRGTYGSGAATMIVDSIELAGSTSGAGTYALPLIVSYTMPNLNPPETGTQEITLMTNVDSTGKITGCYSESESGAENTCSLSRGSFDGTTCQYLSYVHDFDPSTIFDDAIASTLFVKDAFVNQTLKYDAKYVDVAGDTMTGLLNASAGINAGGANVNTSTLTSIRGTFGSATVTSANLTDSLIDDLRGTQLTTTYLTGDTGNLSVSATAPKFEVSGHLTASKIYSRSTFSAPVIKGNTSMTVGGKDVATQSWATSVLFENLTEAQREAILKQIVDNTTDQTGMDAIAKYILNKIYLDKFWLFKLKFLTCPAGEYISAMTVDNDGFLQPACVKAAAPVVEADTSCTPRSEWRGFSQVKIYPFVNELKLVDGKIKYFCSPEITIDHDRCDANDLIDPVQDILVGASPDNVIALKCPSENLHFNNHNRLDCAAIGGTVVKQSSDPDILLCEITASSVPAGWSAYGYYIDPAKNCTGSHTSCPFWSAMTGPMTIICSGRTSTSYSLGWYYNNLSKTYKTETCGEVTVGCVLKDVTCTPSYTKVLVY